MAKKGPVDMESMEGGLPSNVEGRTVDPDRDELVQINKDIKPLSEHMENILKHVPEELKERVSQLQREELSMPGIPRDREAYEAYLGGEKMIRDIQRRKTKADMSFKNLPRQNG